MSRILIENALAVVTLNDAEEVLRGGDVLVDGNRIAAVGQNLRKGLEAGSLDQVIDATDMVVMPGFVNTHHHLYQTFTRNVARVADAKLFDWLIGLYEVWRGITPEDIFVSAQVGLGELLLTGCTTSSDHFYVFPQGLPGDLLDRTIEAAQGLGIRFHATRGSMSRGRSQGGLPPDSVVQDEETILQDCERVISRWHDPTPLAMTRIALAPCSPFSVTSSLLKESAELARKRGVRLHTHLAETLDEEDFCLELHGMRPLDYMESVGWLGHDVWYAHGIHFSNEELMRLASTQTGVCHCPSSNMRLGSGTARIPEMLDMNVPVGLGVDGSASNDASSMREELRHAMLVNRLAWGVDRMPARKVLKVATQGGARVLGRDDIGRLEVGLAADIVLWDLGELGYAGAQHDPASALLFCGTSNRAHTVLVNGKVVVRDGRLTALDERELARKANRMSARLVREASERTGHDYLKGLV